ncbi:hypothetical protein P171DRAFT_457360 [Karstenula rhodostoma CBS 690.94]|uniref:LisH domain-containing protein n=1 Tax=Karstenula rhodostoma CBS 690.94 TaxID=1392251 RepID=A0A9P4U842_9PLEO|nr:hypothetical protein P171DRAFT_457360 [Karstenula rhodostoma CBS 690.94]
MFPTVAELVAHFLRSNGYTESLAAFIDEAGLPVDTGSGNPDFTIEQILQEKKTFDASLRFERLGLEDKDRKWRSIAPSRPIVIESSPRSNILSVSPLSLALPSQPLLQTYLAATTADRRLHLIDTVSSSSSVVQSYSAFQDSPILDVTVLRGRYLLAASMSGKLLLFDTKTEQILDQRKDHGKYVVKIATWSMDSYTVVASVGWDAKVFLYRIGTDSTELRLGEPVATISLPTVPETLLFIHSPETSRPILLLTRRDSTFLYYYAITTEGGVNSAMSPIGKQNLSPHSNAWVAFSPADVQVNPVDSSVVAVATSSTPHMKLLVVKLLLPPEAEVSSDGSEGVISQPATQASQARADRLLQEKEEAAIMVNVSTMAPQTAYSTPRLMWRPDGSGIYVSSDDGVVRGFETNTGRLMASLTAHEPGSKIRCLCAGQANFGADDQEEFLLTGGFDQKLVLWRTG